MSLYATVRFKGIVKKELREIFEPIAMEGKWRESPDPFLRDFGETCMNQSGIPCYTVYSIERWNKEPWERSYNKETGEWIFQAEPNTRRSFNFLDWEDEVIPYCMESVEHYESWMEPLDGPYEYTTYLQRFQDGEWIDIGILDEDGNLIRDDRNIGE